jgi:hypothetical protein
VKVELPCLKKVQIDLGVAEGKENVRAVDQQKNNIMEPRGKKRFREVDEADRSIAVNRDDNLSPFASPTPKCVSEKKSSMIEQAKLDSALLLYNLKDSSRALSEQVNNPLVARRNNGHLVFALREA